MAFIPLSPAEIAADKPTKQELWDKVRLNLDDHESRLTSAEAGLQSFTPIEFKIQGAHVLIGPLTGVDFTLVRNSITIINGLLFVIDSGSGGTLTVDVQVSRNSGASFTSIFTVLPTLTSAAADFATDTGTLDVSETDINIGDILRLDATSFQLGNFESRVLLEFEAQ